LPGTLSAKRVKVTVVLDANELLAVPAPEGKPRVTLRVAIEQANRIITADIAAKSLRRAQKAIREAGTDNIVVTLQGVLGPADAILEAGLCAQPKQPPQQETKG
jgi:glutamate synthase domain-containing protein 3